MAEWQYAERILHVDLTARTFRVAPTALDLKRGYVGGAGFVARLMAEGGEVVLASGPLSQGVAGRLSLGARPGPGQPVSLSSLGGRMAAALKESGFDAIVLTGRLSEPGCLVLNHGQVALESAGDLWGLEVPAAEAAVARQHGAGYASIVLGPGAENQVPFATMAHEGHHAGGGGVAATLGAMRLKAIAVQAPREIPSRCEGCTIMCPGTDTPEAALAGALGLDAPTAARLAALAEGCAREGLLPPVTLADIARREGAGGLLAEGESAVLARLGQAAEHLAADLPPCRRRRGPGIADLLGTCQRVWHERPGQVLREALHNTLGLMATGA
ncbi:MAG TPA: aldehyde ferredoxin oxidoreductase N-terminal domain-containing protein [Symbiobacteriaceae bacterium]|nr:aldehyde ferredoxin oxidoreductase N-terminal domain-containing protein [Symbiobacteriaceae bacterium]